MQHFGAIFAENYDLLEQLRILPQEEALLQAIISRTPETHEMLFEKESLTEREEGVENSTGEGRDHERHKEGTPDVGFEGIVLPC